MSKVIIGLGSNINPLVNINQGKHYLHLHYDVINETIPVKTDPIGMSNAEPFYNCGIEIQTNLTQHELKKELKHLEFFMGRTSHQHGYSDRIIDFDILVWESMVVDKDVYLRPFLKDIIQRLAPQLLIH